MLPSLFSRGTIRRTVQSTTIAELTWRCGCCSELHVGLPAITYASLIHWRDELVCDEKSFLGADLCVIEDRDFFIRCVLEVPILEQSEVLSWGVWLSQSRENFERYQDSRDDDASEETFGFLANSLPQYPETLSLKANAVWRRDGLRPLVDLEPVDHPFVDDWRGGLTLQRAIMFAELCLHGQPN